MPYKDKYDHRYPPAFRPPGGVQRRKIVKGGRWSVRNTIQGPEGFALRVSGRKPDYIITATPWRATSRGKAKYFNRRFATFAEAIDWATRVANALALPVETYPNYQVRQEILADLAREKYPNRKGDVRWLEL